jgi:hypothetical protein
MIESTLDTIHRMNCTFTPLNSMWLLHTMNNAIIIVAQDPHSESVVLACVLPCSCLLEKIIFRRSTPHKDGIERERERAVVPYLWQTSLAAKQLEPML